ncbi:MAG: L-serine ammonia-lyase, iron-sulfur-dependent, subunit alpha [Lachnospiraceae bacterium]|jgi:L-serine dehydratase|nr:L-serine ammonia-lyase, iron-sulfur-dependent, subunit alpha [Lachnospiraceae bacterium]
MDIQSLQEICEQAGQENSSFWEIIQQSDCRENGTSCEESAAALLEMYHSMKDADAQYVGAGRSASGMVGGDGQKLRAYVESGKNLAGPFVGKVMEKAVRMAESNACMGRIVAAPTAGSCGVLPAVLIAYDETYAPGEEKLVESLYVAAGIGQVISARASVSGASGGCQAEIGSASAMAAGALAYLCGGDDKTVCQAAAIALKALLGLTCDPVAGLVEVPCVKRNAVGAVNAVEAADMAMAGITSVIPPDEVIDAMGETGQDMNAKYRETGEGGLAATPTGRAITRTLK